MESKPSSLYGIRLPRLAVADVDERSQELFDLVEKECGASPVQVNTPRGRHLYFANPEGRFEPKLPDAAMCSNGCFFLASVIVDWRIIASMSL